MLTNCTALAVYNNPVLQVTITSYLYGVWAAVQVGADTARALLFVRLICLLVLCKLAQTEADGDEDFFDAEESQEWLQNPGTDAVEISLDAPVQRLSYYCCGSYVLL